MFGNRTSTAGRVGTGSGAAVLDVGVIGGFTGALQRLDPGAGDADRVDQLRALETAKCAIEAAQAELAAGLDASVRAAEADAGVHPDRRGRGVALQVALARRESHHRGKQHLALARVVRPEMPWVWAAFRAGRITERRVQVLARETACLSAGDRATVDRELAGDPARVGRLEGMGEAEIAAKTRKLAYRLDPHGFTERARRAAADRRVTCRPAPDTMTHLSALLPVTQGVAVFAALTRAADSARAAGDPRTRGQVMADTLLERVLGSTAVPGSSPVVPVAVDLVLSDHTLLGGGHEPAHLLGYGPIPAPMARDLVADAHGAALVALRRLYAAPQTGELVAMESTARIFPADLARFLRLRDRTCRTPWCDAPIRHSDHVEPATQGGPTTGHNGQGLCEACNHAKQARGWTARPRPGPTHTVETTTPTGHTYRSQAPPAPGHTAPDPITTSSPARVDYQFVDIEFAA